MEREKEERLPVSVSAAVFIENEEGGLLLLKQAAERKGGKWGPPPGGMHAHENPIDAALRETNEEIGAEVELIDILGIYTIDRGDSACGIGFVFRGKIVRGEVKPPKDEIADYRFFTQTQARELIKKDLLYKPEYNLQCIEDWLGGSSYPLGVVKPLLRD